MVNFRRTGDADYPRYLKILNMAPPKAGKTTFESTAPNVLICATQNAGLMSIAHLNVPYVEITHTEELKQVLMILQSDSMRAQLASQYGLTVIETVVVDLFNEIQQLFVKERLKSERRSQMQRDDWNWLLNQMRELTDALVALPMNVILSTHIKTTQDDESRIITAPALQGGFQEEIAGKVDFVVMNERVIEIDPASGKKSVRYSLRVEGDNRNPHLGNRAAGRLPTEVEPKFQVLHDAVFSRMDELAKSSTVDMAPAAAPAVPVQTDVESEAAPVPVQEVTQTPNQVTAVPEQAAAPAPAEQSEQPASAPVPGEVAPPQAEGTPGEAPSDEDDPINDAGIKHLTKFYKDAGYNVPDFAGWTLGIGRATARMFVAVKADVAEGKGTWQPMVDYLKGLDQDLPYQVWNGPEPKPEPVAEPAPEPVTEPVAETPAEPTPEASPTPESPSEQAEAAVTPEAPAADTSESALVTPESSPAVEETPASADVEAEALSSIQENLGGRVIGVVEGEGKPCEVCNSPIDDIDIARLAKSRFEKWVCVKDYISLTKTQ